MLLLIPYILLLYSLSLASFSFRLDKSDIANACLVLLIS